MALRKRKITKVTLSSSENFFDRFNLERDKFVKRNGLKKLGQAAFSEILYKQGFFNKNVLTRGENDKRKKRTGR